MGDPVKGTLLERDRVERVCIPKGSTLILTPMGFRRFEGSGFGGCRYRGWVVQGLRRSRVSGRSRTSGLRV